MKSYEIHTSYNDNEKTKRFTTAVFTSVEYSNWILNSYKTVDNTDNPIIEIKVNHHY